MLVCDGAMGTMLYSRGVFLNRCVRRAEPDPAGPGRRSAPGLRPRRRRRHRDEHVRRQPHQAGAFGLADRTAINTEGARIARHAAREQVYVAGAIGPLGIRIEPWGKTGVDEAESLLPRTGGGTARRRRRPVRPRDVPRPERDRRGDPRRAQPVRAADRRAGHDRGGRQQPRRRGAGDVRAAARSARRRRRRPQLQRRPGGDARDASSGWRRSRPVRLSAQPNAGRPREVEGRNIYLCSPEYMASYARRFINNGVRLVGGCCGTTPDHIRQIKAAVRAVAPGGSARRGGVAGSRARPQARCGAARSCRAAEKSRMANALARGGFVVSVELLPPRGYRADDADRAGAPAADPRRRPGQHSRRPARQRADERAGDGGAGPAGRDRDDPPLRLPRPEPARHAVGPARRALDGRSATC